MYPHAVESEQLMARAVVDDDIKSFHARPPEDVHVPDPDVSHEARREDEIDALDDQPSHDGQV